MQKLSELLKPKLKYLVAATILTVPLYPKFPLARLPYTYVSIRLEDFLMLAVGFAIAPVIINDIKIFLTDRFNRSLLIFLITAVLSLISGIFVLKTINPTLGLLHWLRRLEYILPFYAGYYSIRHDRRNLKFYFGTLLTTLLLVFMYGFGQKYLNWPFIITQNQEYAKGIALYSIPGGHISSTFAGHYDLASFLVLTLPVVSIALFTRKTSRTNYFESGVLAFVLLSGIWLISLSGSRISALSFLFSSTIALLIVKKYKNMVILISISIFIFASSSNLVARYRRIIDVSNIKIRQIIDMVGENRSFLVKHAYAQLPIPEKREKADPTPTPMTIFEDRSSSIRFNIEWPRAVRAFQKNPLLGTGYSSITLATDNDYLRILGETGLLGLLSFFAVLGYIYINYAKVVFSKTLKRLDKAFLVGMGAGLLGVLMNAIFIDIFEASKFAIMFWLFSGITMALVKYNYNE